MSESARRLATWEDLLTMPEDGRVWEVLNGQIEVQPRPLPRHSRTQARLSGKLSDPFDQGDGGPGGWWLLIEPEARLAPHEIVVPDLAGWRRQRLPQFPETRPIDVGSLLVPLPETPPESKDTP